MGILNDSDSMGNLELGGTAVGGSSLRLLTKSIRVLLAAMVLGSVAAYGAITVKPELVDYLSFIPGMESVETQCSAGSCCDAVGESDCSARSSEDSGGACPSLVNQPFMDPSDEAAAEDVGTAEL